MNSVSCYIKRTTGKGRNHNRKREHQGESRGIDGWQRMLCSDDQIELQGCERRQYWHLYFTLTSETIGRASLNWRVIEDHLCMTPIMSTRKTPTPGVVVETLPNLRTKVTPTINRRKDSILSKLDPAKSVVGTIMSLIDRVCHSYMPRKRNIRGKKRSAYW